MMADSIQEDARNKLRIDQRDRGGERVEICFPFSFAGIFYKRAIRFHLAIHNQSIDSLSSSCYKRRLTYDSVVLMTRGGKKKDKKKKGGGKRE